MNLKLEKIKEEELIFDYRTFQNYKAAYFNKDEEGDDKVVLNEEQERLFEEFFRVIKKHLILQKQKLFQNLTDQTLRQKYAWIIERKF